MPNDEQTGNPADVNLSVSWVNNLTKDTLKTVLKAAGLTVEGSVDDLRERFSKHLQTSRTATDSVPPSPNTPPQISQFSIAKICNQVRKWDLTFDSNSDPISFLERLQELCHCYEIKENEMLTALPLVFRNDTLLWYRNTKSKWSCWEDFLDDFKLQYLHPRYNRMIEEEIRSRRQGPKESFKNYLTAISTLMRRGKPRSVSDQYDRIYDNLHPDYKLYIRYDSTASIPELFQRAMEYEQVTMEQEKFVKGSSKVNTMSQIDHGETADTPRQETHQNNALYTGKRRYDGRQEMPHQQPKLPTSESEKLSHPHARCWRCTQTGHRRKGCTNPSKLFCGRCGTTGILGRDCRCPGITKKKRFTDMNTTGVSGEDITIASAPLVQNDHDRRIFVTVNIGGTEYDALIDSGASTSCIDKKTADSFKEKGIQYQQNTGSKIFLADGRMVKPLGIMKIPTRIDNVERVADFLIMPGHGSPVILGMDLLDVFGAVIDIRDRKVSFKPIIQENSPITHLSVIDNQNSVSAAGSLRPSNRTCNMKSTQLAESASNKPAKTVKRHRQSKSDKSDLPKTTSLKSSEISTTKSVPMEPGQPAFHYTQPNSSSQPSSPPETGMILYNTFTKANLFRQFTVDANKSACMELGPKIARSVQTSSSVPKFIGPILPKRTKQTTTAFRHLDQMGCRELGDEELRMTKREVLARDLLRKLRQ